MKRHNAERSFRVEKYSAKTNEAPIVEVEIRRIQEMMATEVQNIEKQKAKLDDIDHQLRNVYHQQRLVLERMFSLVQIFLDASREGKVERYVLTDQCGVDLQDTATGYAALRDLETRVNSYKLQVVATRDVRRGQRKRRFQMVRTLREEEAMLETQCKIQRQRETDFFEKHGRVILTTCAYKSSRRRGDVSQMHLASST